MNRSVFTTSIKKLTYVLLAAALLISCRGIDSLQGVWLSHYQTSEKGDRKPVYRKFLLEVEPDTVVFIWLGGAKTKDSNELVIEKHPFDRQTGLIRTTANKKLADSLLLSFRDGDRFILRPPSGEYFTVFTELDEQVSSGKVEADELTGKVFVAREAGANTPQLVFVNDTTLLESDDYYTNYYRIITYKNLNFITGGSYLQLAGLIVTKDDAGELRITGYSEGFARYTRTVPGSSCTRLDLTGRWKEIKRTSGNAPIANNARETLIITPDNITRFRSGYKTEAAWQLLPGGRAMYFPRTGKQKPYIEKILQCSDSLLILNRHKGFTDRDSLVVSYEKID